MTDFTTAARSEERPVTYDHDHQTASMPVGNGITLYAHALDRGRDGRLSGIVEVFSPNGCLGATQITISDHRRLSDFADSLHGSHGLPADQYLKYLNELYQGVESVIREVLERRVPETPGV